jgi:hypothetical protein
MSFTEVLFDQCGAAVERVAKEKEVKVDAMLPGLAALNVGLTDGVIKSARAPQPAADQYVM